MKLFSSEKHFTFFSGLFAVLCLFQSAQILAYSDASHQAAALVPVRYELPASAALHRGAAIERPSARTVQQNAEVQSDKREASRMIRTVKIKK